MELRDYQKNAINAFKNNNDIGILDMATGTGKTITSIKAVNYNYQQNQRQFLVIIVPFLHLIAQWKNNLLKNNIYVDLEIAHSSIVWKNKLPQLIWDFNNHILNRVVLIGTYRSMANEEFINNLQRLNFNNTFLLADECHYLGASNSRQKIYKSFNYRLGLSATPSRWWDQIGTDFIDSVFNKIIFEYGMDKAIMNHYLTEYNYHPQFINLTEDEQAQYDKLSNKISKLMNAKHNGAGVSDDDIQPLLLKRSRIIKNADNKLQIFQETFLKQKNFAHTLVYCSNKSEINKIRSFLAKHMITSEAFDSDLNSFKRRTVLRAFDKGKINVLVAVKCLDEGVDVPSTKNAYFLASSSNPREFVQRRGRILRLSNHKNLAEIYDFVLLPPNDYNDSFGIESVIKHEFPRVYELNKYSSNKYSIRKELENILLKYNLERYIDMSPEDIYKEYSEEK